MQVNHYEEQDWCGYKMKPFILETGYIINLSMNTWGKKYKLSGENYGPEIKINSEVLDKLPDFVQAQLYLLPKIHKKQPSVF